MEECAVRVMHKKLNLSSDGGDLVAGNANEATVGSGGVCAWQESGNGW
jgi:hypothetical protein